MTPGKTLGDLGLVKRTLRRTEVLWDELMKESSNRRKSKTFILFLHVRIKKNS